MKNCYSPTHAPAAAPGAAAATMLLTHEPLGLSLTPRMEMDLRETQVRAPTSKRMTPSLERRGGCRNQETSRSRVAACCRKRPKQDERMPEKPEKQKAKQKQAEADASAGCSIVKC